MNHSTDEEKEIERLILECEKHGFGLGELEDAERELAEEANQPGLTDDERKFLANLD
jgi:hypothetical protein